MSNTRNTLAMICVAQAALVAPAAPQAAPRNTTARSVTADADLMNAPGGIQLLHLVKGTSLAVGAASAGGFAATIEGWIPENAMHDDKRDGFDTSVSLATGTTLRDKVGGIPLASARLGALFDRIETRAGWVHVKRTGWIAAAAFVAPVAGAPSAPPAAATQRPAAGNAGLPTTVAAGSILSAEAGGSAVGTLESPLHASVLEHKGGWAHVQIDAWVKDASLGNAPTPTGITAAEIRAAPEKYVGQTVEWTLQLLGIQKADELRPELPVGQPYLLARGPLPEPGFVYVALTNAEAETFRKLEPLAKIRIRATIRAGKSRFLPTPVLNFVRRLD